MSLKMVSRRYSHPVRVFPITHSYVLDLVLSDAGTSKERVILIGDLSVGLVAEAIQYKLDLVGSPIPGPCL
jgi:hypothetical protein